MKKKIRKIFLTALLAGFCFLFMPTQQNSVHAETTEYIWYSNTNITSQNQLFNSYVLRNTAAVYTFNQDTYIYLQFYDKKRTSTIYYSTDWIEFSRIRKDVNPLLYTYYNNLPKGIIDEKSRDPHQYFTSAGLTNTRYSVRFYIDAFHTKSSPKDKNGYIITTKWISLAKLKRAIQEKNANWYNEIQSDTNAGKQFWLGVDGIIRVYHGSVVQGNYNDKTNSCTGKCYKWDTWYPKLMTCEAWSNPYDFEDHFKKYIPFYATKIYPTSDDKKEDEFFIIKEDSSEADLETTDSYLPDAAPSVTTGNYNTKFDIGTAIPTTEVITNETTATRWYGKVRLKQHTGTKTVKFTFKLYGSYTISGEGYSYTIDVGTYDSPCEFTREYKQNYEYYTVDYTWLYQLDDLQVFNGAYGFSDHSGSSAINYTFPDKEVTLKSSKNTVDQEVTYKVRIATGTATRYGMIAQTYQTGTDIVIPTSNKVSWHVYKPDDKEESTRSVGGWSSYSEVYQAMMDYIDGRMDYYTSCGDYDLVVYNDELTINGRAYLTEEKLVDKSQYNADNILYVGANESKATNALVDFEASADTTIPEQTENGPYITSITAQYERFMYQTPKTRTFSADSEDEINGKTIIKNKYTENEPVIVYSPVMSPIHIDGEEKAQSSSYPGVQRLNVDETYTVEFDWEDFFAKQYKGYDNPAGYTKYVKDKEVAFPFSIMIDGKYYETDEKFGGYTDYIPVGAVESFEIYIPAWAKTGRYITTPLKVRCMANNYASYMDETAESYEFNEYYEKYVATYEYPVQICGILYAFQVNSVNNGDLFGVPDLDQRYFNFAKRGYEHKTGTSNRFGDPYTRRSADESILYNWSTVNTLPFAIGKSNLAAKEDGTLYNSDDPHEVLTLNGTFKKGQQFTFSLKSIINTTDDTEVKIKPVYRYVDKNGNVNEDISLYYIDDDGGFKNIYDDDAERTMETYLDEAGHIGARYNYWYDTLQITAMLKNASSQYAMTHEKTECSTAGEIILTKDLSLYTGNEEELQANKTRSATTSLRYDSTLLDLPVINRDDGINGTDETEPSEYVAPDTENQNVDDAKTGEEDDVYDSNYRPIPTIPSYPPLGSSNSEEVEKEKTVETPEEAEESFFAKAIQIVQEWVEKAVDVLSESVVTTQNDELSSASLGKITKEQYEEFEKCMQTWYGKYEIPESLMVVKNSDLAAFKGKGYTDPIYAYMDSKNGINTDDEIFLDDGFLVLSFEIELIRDGETQLYYYDTSDSSIKDMWQTESGRAPQTVYATYTKDKVVPIKVQSGDVAVIDLRGSGVAGDYIAVPWMLN